LKDPTTGHLDICFIYVNLFSGHYWVDLFISIYLLTAIGLTPCGSSTVHIYTQNKSKRIPSIFNDESTESFICLWKLAVAVAT
jgi:hypothetical protein